LEGGTVKNLDIRIHKIAKPETPKRQKIIEEPKSDEHVGIQEFGTLGDKRSIWL
jgi:hypothetical protein